MRATQEQIRQWTDYALAIVKADIAKQVASLDRKIQSCRDFEKMLDAEHKRRIREHNKNGRP